MRHRFGDQAQAGRKGFCDHHGCRPAAAADLVAPFCRKSLFRLKLAVEIKVFMIARPTSGVDTAGEHPMSGTIGLTCQHLNDRRWTLLISIAPKLGRLLRLSVFRVFMDSSSSGGSINAG